MTLYEISKEIMDAIEYGCDPETGEVIDAVQLDALQMAFDDKVENCLLFIKELRAEQAALKAEEDALAKRRRVSANKETWLSKYVQGVLMGEKFKTARCAVSYRKTQAVSIVDESAIPAQYLKITTAPMKAEIKDALKRGEQVAGAVLEDRQSMIVK